MIVFSLLCVYLKFLLILFSKDSVITTYSQLYVFLFSTVCVHKCSLQNFLESFIASGFRLLEAGQPIIIDTAVLYICT